MYQETCNTSMAAAQKSKLLVHLANPKKFILTKSGLKSITISAVFDRLVDETIEIFSYIYTI